MSVRVVTAAEAAAADRGAIDAGIPSRALMQRAGAAAATEIALRYPRAIRRGVTVYAGPGNNGGDGWVVAGALVAAGIPARVVQVGELRTAEARLVWARTEVMVGTTRPLVSDLNPVSVAAVGEAGVAGAAVEERLGVRALGPHPLPQRVGAGLVEHR